MQSWTGNVITKPSDSTGSWSGQEAVISVALLLRTWMAEPLWKAYPWPSVEAAAHKHKTPKSSITGWVIFPRSSENSCEGGPATHTNRYGKAVYRRTTLGTIPTPKAQQEQTVMQTSARAVHSSEQRDLEPATGTQRYLKNKAHVMQDYKPCVSPMSHSN